MTASDKRNESPGERTGQKPSPAEPSGRAGTKLLWGGLIVAVLVVGLGGLVWLESGGARHFYPVIFFTDSPDAAEPQGAANPVVKDW